MTRYVFAYDPGLTCTACAVFDTAARPNAPGWLAWVDCVSTTPATPLAQRLAAIAALVDQARLFLPGLDGAHAITHVIEAPGVKAAYRRHQRGKRDPAAALQKSLGSVHQVIGALVLRAQQAGAEAVHLVPAPRVASKTKGAQAGALLKTAGITKHNEHERSATWLGAWWLTKGVAA